MNDTMEKEEIIDLLDQYLNEKGMWVDFTEWVESRGYTVSELGFEDE